LVAGRSARKLQHGRKHECDRASDESQALATGRKGWLGRHSPVSDVPEDARFAVGSADRRVLAMNGDRLEREDA